VSGACPCADTQDPQVVSNPPGLATIADRVDDFSGFRRALLEPLEGESSLFGWRPAPGDLGLQPLEWWAYLADILTFYNERIANESYLRTAELPANVSAIVALLGYQPRPAIGAKGQIAAIRGTARPHEPLVIAPGMPVANTATPAVPAKPGVGAKPGVPVQTFEADPATFSGRSDAPIELPPSDALLLAAEASPPAAAGGQPDNSLVGSVLLRGNVTSLRAGDELLAIARSWSSSKPGYWAKLSVVSTATEPDPNGGKNTRVVLDAAQLDEVKGWMQEAKAADYRLVRATQAAALWTQPAEETVAIKDVTDSELSVPLSAVVRGIASGGLVLLDGGASGTAVGFVIAAEDGFVRVHYPVPAGAKPPKPPDIPIAHTVLRTLTPYASWVASHLTQAASVTVRFGLKDVGTLIGAPMTTLESEPVLSNTSQPLPVAVSRPGGLNIAAGGVAGFVEDSGGAAIAVKVNELGEGSLRLTASTATPSTFSLTAPLRLLIDLVDVSRGKTVASEELGSGDAAVAGQTFTLKQSPLTYLANGPEYASTLQIAVDGILWSEVATFYGQPAAATVFVVTQLPDATSVVRFGDGINGARLPSGSRIIAGYRYGAGTASPPAGRLTTILAPQANLASIRNPVAVWGGADAERASEVRQNAPASVLTFGRAISADDYETVAALAPGVARARAYWTWDSTTQRALVKVYVGDDEGAASSASGALEGAEDPNRPVAVEQATPIELVLRCTLLVAVDRVPASVQAAAESALADPEVGLFSAAGMAIGQALYSSQIEAALLVAGAEAVQGLKVTAAGTDIFGGEPIGTAAPGEGSFYTLAASAIVAVKANG